MIDMNVGRLVEPVTGRQWDPQQIAKQVAARAARLQRGGLQRGDRVFLHFGNRVEFFAELLAIWRLGGCAIPIDNRLTHFEIETLARTATPRFSLADDTMEPKTAELMTSMNVGVLNSLEVEAATEQPSAGGIFLDDDALILFTSGSTGSPKGVVHTHRSLRARWIALRQSLGVDAFRRTLCLLPSHFGHGLICNSLFPWLSGQDLIIAPPFKPELIMKLGALIDDHGITFLSSVPSMWRLALKLSRPPRGETLRRVHCGSAPLSAHVWRQIQDWTGTSEVINAYGITETGSWVAGISGHEVVPEDGLVGEPWGAVIRILETRETDPAPGPDAIRKPGDAGYVWINTPALMRGYFNRDDLTQEVVCNGWFMTGDIGFLDDGGRLYLKGRERDEINKGGMKIFPADVDAVVERFRETTDVCTFGFQDPTYGENVGMAVSLASDDTKTIRNLYEWMKQHLADHKLPVRWHLVDSIPRTSRGKINRQSVMETCSALEPLDLPSILSASRPSTVE